MGAGSDKSQICGKETYERNDNDRTGLRTDRAGSCIVCSKYYLPDDSGKADTKETEG